VTTWLVTGGAGFIGGNFVLDAVRRGVRVVNLDVLTYAGNLDTLASLADNPNHVFVQGDIGDRALVERLLREHRPDAVVNFAAESHVDRSIDGPAAFVHTNVVGTLALLEAARGLLEVAGGRRQIGVPLPARVHRRGLRLARRDRQIHRDHAVRAQLAVLRVEGRVRPSGPRLPPHLRPAGPHHQLLEQLRPVPVPGKAHPADHRARACRRAAAGLRRREERARLAVRRGPLRRDPRRARTRPGGRNLQRRRRRRTPEHRRGEDHLRAARRTPPARRRQAARVADHLRRRPPGPRPPLCDRRRQAEVRTRLGARAHLRTGHRRHRRLVPGPPGLGASASPTAAIASNASGPRHDDDAQGHHPGRRFRHAPVSDHQGDQQAAAAGVRQADDLLPAERAHARGHPRSADHQHAARAGLVPQPHRRRLAVGHAHRIRRAAEPRRASRRPT
jgi:hypothetical protein